MEQLAADWLAPGALLRVLFVGSARPHGLGIRWTRPYDPDVTHTRCCCVTTTHVDEHDCSKACRALQADTCAAVCGWHEKAGDSWKGLSLLSVANHWTPGPILPIGALAVMWSGIYNFEVICRLGDGSMDMNGETLASLVRTLAEFHTSRAGGGRTELRYGGEARLSSSPADEESGEQESATRGVLFVDFGIKPAGFAGAFAVLRQFGVTSCALHTGKYQGNDLLRAAEGAGVRVVTGFRIYWP